MRKIIIYEYKPNSDFEIGEIMKKIRTNSFFVTIYEINNKRIIKRRKRKGLHAYPRTMQLNHINKVLNKTLVNFPRMYFNGINNVYEEFIISKVDVEKLDNLEIIDHVVEYITNLYQVNYNKKILWKNNSDFFKFQINNLKIVLKEKNPENIDVYLSEIDKLYMDVDNDRKMCFIHGDIHKENMIINDKFYLIDWELATYGDLAYELAMHFILMGYSDEEKEKFIKKLCNNLPINSESLKNDIEVYNNFERYRKDILKRIGRTKEK